MMSRIVRSPIPLRFVLISIVIIGLVGGIGTAAADTPENAKACPEAGNPSNGLVQSVISSNGNSLHAIRGVNQAFESVGCETRLP